MPDVYINFFEDVTGKAVLMTRIDHIFCRIYTHFAWGDIPISLPIHKQNAQ